MCNRLGLFVIAWLSAIALLFTPFVGAQTSAPAGSAAAQTGGVSSKIADVSGDWSADPKRGGIGQSLSLSDIGGKNRGKEPDIPYQPWALAKTMSERTPTGPDARFDNTTDLSMKYWDPQGVPRIYMWPAKTKLVQTPDTVYCILLSVREQLSPSVAQSQASRTIRIRRGGEIRSAGMRMGTRW